MAGVSAGLHDRLKKTAVISKLRRPMSSKNLELIILAKNGITEHISPSFV
ncbi:MAG: hypothetical protein KGY44_10210 [Halanaerobiales bacterium]|nr:hypothetical protein [Halanaerobiales bacterium]